MMNPARKVTALTNPEGRFPPMSGFIDTLNTVIWSPVLVFLCLGAGIYFTVVTKFLQIRCIPDMIKQLKDGESSES